MSTTKTLSIEAQAAWDKAMAMALDYGTVRNECIASPGKYEGEWFPVIYFHGQAMDGLCDDGDDGSDLLIMTGAEAEAFGGFAARLHYSEQGFVSLEITEKE